MGDIFVQGLQVTVVSDSNSYNDIIVLGYNSAY